MKPWVLDFLMNKNQDFLTENKIVRILQFEEFKWGMMASVTDNDIVIPARFGKTDVDGFRVEDSQLRFEDIIVQVEDYNFDIRNENDKPIPVLIIKKSHFAGIMKGLKFRKPRDWESVDEIKSLIIDWLFRKIKENNILMLKAKDTSIEIFQEDIPTNKNADLEPIGQKPNSSHTLMALNESFVELGYSPKMSQDWKAIFVDCEGKDEPKKLSSFCGSNGILIMSDDIAFPEENLDEVWHKDYNVGIQMNESREYMEGEHQVNIDQLSPICIPKPYLPENINNFKSFGPIKTSSQITSQDKQKHNNDSNANNKFLISSEIISSDKGNADICSGDIGAPICSEHLITDHGKLDVEDSNEIMKAVASHVADDFTSNADNIAFNAVADALRVKKYKGTLDKINQASYNTRSKTENSELIEEKFKKQIFERYKNRSFKVKYNQYANLFSDDKIVTESFLSEKTDDSKNCENVITPSDINAGKDTSNIVELESKAPDINKLIKRRRLNSSEHCASCNHQLHREYSRDPIIPPDFYTFNLLDFQQKKITDIHDCKPTNLTNLDTPVNSLESYQPKSKKSFQKSDDLNPITTTDDSDEQSSKGLIQNCNQDSNSNQAATQNCNPINPSGSIGNSNSGVIQLSGSNSDKNYDSKDAASNYKAYSSLNMSHSSPYRTLHLASSFNLKKFLFTTIDPRYLLTTKNCEDQNTDLTIFDQLNEADAKPAEKSDQVIFHKNSVSLRMITPKNSLPSHQPMQRPTDVDYLNLFNQLKILDKVQPVRKISEKCHLILLKHLNSNPRF